MTVCCGQGVHWVGRIDFGAINFVQVAADHTCHIRYICILAADYRRWNDATVKDISRNCGLRTAQEGN